MSSKIYITNKMPEHYDYISKGNGNWDEWAAKPDIGQGSYTSHAIDSNRYGDPRSNLDVVVTPTARPWRVGLYAGVSRILLPQTILNNIKVVLAVAQTTPSEVYTKINVFLLNSTAGLGNGVFYRTILNYEDGPATPSQFSKKGIQWPYIPTSLSPVPTPVVLKFDGIWPPFEPIPVPNDGKEYRLVIEIGAISYAPSGDVGLQHRFGVRFDNLMPRDDAPSPESATYLEWNEFSSTEIQFNNYKYLPPNHEVELATPINLGTTQIVNEPYRFYHRWYKYTPTIDTVMSFQACSEVDSDGSALQLYMQEAAPQIPNIPAKDWGISGGNVVFNHSVQANKGILIKTRPVKEFTYNWSLQLAQTPNVAVKKGDLFISSDEFNPNFYDPTLKGLYPVIWHSPTLGDIRTLSGKYPATKVGACLFDGTWALSQPQTGELFLFRRAPFLTPLERVQTDLKGGITTMGTDFFDFYVLGRMPNYNSGENRTLIRIIRGMTADEFKWTLPLTTAGGARNGAACMGVSRDSKVLYYNDYKLGGQVQRHNLEFNTVMTPFVATPGVDYYPEDIIVLADDTVVCLFRNSTGTTTIIYRYAADGTFLNTIQIQGAYIGPIHHIAHSSDDFPDRFWMWVHLNYPTPTSPVTNAFILIRTTDSVHLTGFGQTYGYVNGRGPNYVGGPPALPICGQPRWGSALKGTLIPMMISPELSGIYFLNGAKKHDTYYNSVERRIPDPTIRTALLGE